MKKLLMAITISFAFAACNNDSSDPNRDQNDSLNATPTNRNDDVQGDRAPTDNTVSKDTSSYERMSNQSSDTTHH